MTQEQLSELLKPRYIVENLYPGCEFIPGDILVKIPHSNAFSIEGGAYAIPEDDIDKYPYLFRKLEWWEEIAPEQMPKYIKLGVDYHKIDKWHFDHVYPIAEFMDGQTLRRKSVMNWNIDPATETDYNEYLQTLTHNQEP